MYQLTKIFWRSSQFGQSTIICYNFRLLFNLLFSHSSRSCLYTCTDQYFHIQLMWMYIYIYQALFSQMYIYIRLFSANC